MGTGDGGSIRNPKRITGGIAPSGIRLGSSEMKVVGAAEQVQRDLENGAEKEVAAKHVANLNKLRENMSAAEQSELDQFYSRIYPEAYGQTPEGSAENVAGFMQDAAKEEPKKSQYADYDVGVMERIASGELKASDEDVRKEFERFSSLYDNSEFIDNSTFHTIMDKARNDPELQRTVLKLLAIADMKKESKSGSRRRMDESAQTVKASMDGLEKQVNNHLSFLNGMEQDLETDPQNLNLDIDDPLHADKAPFGLFYYKTLLSDPKTRALLQIKKEQLPAQFPINQGHIADDNYREPQTREQMRKAMDSAAKPMHEMKSSDVDDIRWYAGLGHAMPTPEIVKEQLADQPVAANIFRLIADKSGSPSEENTEVRSYAKRFDEWKPDLADSLTSQEKHAIIKYTGAWYRPVNNFMRSVAMCLEGYRSAKDEDARESFSNRLYTLLNEAKKSGIMAGATNAMTGMLKMMKGNKPRVVTRGGTESSLKTAGLEAGKQIYDPAFSSAADIENWGSGWSTSKTQYVLVTDKYVDIGDMSLNPGESEMLLFPGIVFGVDVAKRYNAPYTLGKNVTPISIDVIAGRQLGMSEKGKPAKTSAQGAERLKKTEFSDHQTKEKEPTSVEDYEKRYGDIGAELYKKLFEK